MDIKIILMICSVVTLAIAAPQQQKANAAETTAAKQQAAKILNQVNKVNDDGSYTYGYEADDGSFKVETRGKDGVVKGKYGFVDANGELKTVEYTAGEKSDDPEDAGDDESNSEVQGAAQTPSRSKVSSGGSRAGGSRATASENDGGDDDGNGNDISNDDFGSYGEQQQGQPQFFTQGQGAGFSPFAGGQFAGGQPFVGPQGQVIGGSPQFLSQGQFQGQGPSTQGFSGQNLGTFQGQGQPQFQGQGLGAFGGQPQFQGQLSGFQGSPQFQDGFPGQFQGQGPQLQGFQGQPQFTSGGFPGNRPQAVRGQSGVLSQGGVSNGQPFESLSGGQFSRGPISTGFPLVSNQGSRAVNAQGVSQNDGQFSPNIALDGFSEDADQDGFVDPIPQNQVQGQRSTPTRLSGGNAGGNSLVSGIPPTTRQGVVGLSGNPQFQSQGQPGTQLLFNGQQGPQVFSQGQQLTEEQIQQLYNNPNFQQGLQQGLPQGFSTAQGVNPNAISGGFPQQFNPQFQQFNPQQFSSQPFNPQQFNGIQSGFPVSAGGPSFQGGQQGQGFPVQVNGNQGTSQEVGQVNGQTGFTQIQGGTFSPSSNSQGQEFTGIPASQQTNSPRGPVPFPGFIPGNSAGQQIPPQFLQQGQVSGQPQAGGQSGGRIIQSPNFPFDFNPYGINGLGIPGGVAGAFPGQFGGVQPGGFVGGSGQFVGAPGQAVVLGGQGQRAVQGTSSGTAASQESKSPAATDEAKKTT